MVYNDAPAPCDQGVLPNGCITQKSVSKIGAYLPFLLIDPLYVPPDGFLR